MQCPQCWKPISVLATRCPECTTVLKRSELWTINIAGTVLAAVVVILLIKLIF